MGAEVRARLSSWKAASHSGVHRKVGQVVQRARDVCEVTDKGAVVTR